MRIKLIFNFEKSKIYDSQVSRVKCMFCCLQRQGCFEPDDMDASGFGPPIPTILTFGGQRDVNLTPQQSLTNIPQLQQLPQQTQQQSQHQHQHHHQQQQQQQPSQPQPQPLPPPPVPVSATGGTHVNSYGPVSQSTNANNIINTNKEPYSVINPKILTGSLHRPSYPHIETAHGGWPIGFESAISGKLTRFS